MLQVMLLGHGRWGRNYVRVLDEENGIRLAQFIDSSTNRVAPLDLAGLDAVIIATPAATHYALASRVLQQNTHVLCEKPLCLKATQAAELHRMARDRGLVLRTGHVYQYNPLVQCVRGGLEGMQIGIPLSMFFRQAGMGPVRRDVGVIYDRAVHGLSIFQAWLQQPPCCVSAVGRGKGPAEATLSLIYPGDVMGTVSVSWHSHRKECYGWLNATRATVAFDDCTKNIASYYQGSRSPLRVPSIQPLTAQVRAFATAIRDRLPNHAEMDCAIIAALEAARQSYEAHGAPITVKGVTL
jgi:predicted dehydrogenase